MYASAAIYMRCVGNKVINRKERAGATTCNDSGSDMWNITPIPNEVCGCDQWGGVILVLRRDVSHRRYT
jgi:hypothetical protein